jgi:transcriptional regulator with XRE-family HTH domain
LEREPDEISVPPPQLPTRICVLCEAGGKRPVTALHGYRDGVPRPPHLTRQRRARPVMQRKASPRSDEHSPRSSTGMDVAGPRLRAARQHRGLSLAEVANAADVTKGFLSLAERAKTQVSVPTLMRICDALDIKLGALFDYPSETVVGVGAVLNMGGVGLDEYLLTPSDQRHLQAIRTVVQPGGGSGGAYRTEAEAIFVLVVRGAMDLTVDGDVRRLHAGDTTTFPASALHEWCNPSPEIAELIWVVTPPIPSEGLKAHRRNGAARTKKRNRG